MPYLMRGRNESVAYHEASYDITRTTQWLEPTIASIRIERATLFDLFLWAVAYVAHARPGINRFVSSGRIYQRARGQLVVRRQEAIRLGRPAGHHQAPFSRTAGTIRLRGRADRRRHRRGLQRPAAGGRSRDAIRHAAAPVRAAGGVVGLPSAGPLQSAARQSHRKRPTLRQHVCRQSGLAGPGQHVPSPLRTRHMQRVCRLGLPKRTVVPAADGRLESPRRCGRCAGRSTSGSPTASTAPAACGCSNRSWRTPANSCPSSAVTVIFQTALLRLGRQGGPLACGMATWRRTLNRERRCTISKGPGRSISWRLFHRCGPSRPTRCPPRRKRQRRCNSWSPAAMGSLARCWCGSCTAAGHRVPLPAAAHLRYRADRRIAARPSPGDVRERGNFAHRDRRARGRHPPGRLEFLGPDRFAGHGRNLRRRHRQRAGGAARAAGGARGFTFPACWPSARPAAARAGR